MKNWKLFAGCVILYSVNATAQFSVKAPAEIPASSAVIPSEVRCLAMEFYPFDPNAPKGLDSLDEAILYASRSQPQAALDLNLPAVDFPFGVRTIGGTNSSLGDYFFGKDSFASRLAQGMRAAPRISQPIGQRSVFILKGFVKVDKAGAYKLRVPVDDGAEVKIGGIVVFQKNEFGGMAQFDDPAYAAEVSFAAPGIYPLRVIHWDRGNELGIHILSDIGNAAGEFTLLPIMTVAANGP